VTSLGASRAPSAHNMGVALSGVCGLGESWHVAYSIRRAARHIVLSPKEAASFSGHSMLVGTAQDLLKRGFDTAAIMRAGGWKSVNVLARYLEKAEHNVWT